jgi:outer membrane lipoprotein carrier protein
VQNLKMLRGLCVVGLGLLAVGTVHAGVATDRLNAFFAEQGTLRAAFVQTVEGAAFSQPQESRGILVMQRPGKFRWDYQQPYAQQIVADGKDLWVYDVDLEQVVVKPQDEALGDTPALLLSGGGSVASRFEVTELAAQGDGLSWVQLTPKQKDSGFSEIRLGFGKHDLQRMVLKDNFGQVTRLRFSKMEHNVSVPPATFHFVPPKGVDVVGKP